MVELGDIIDLIWVAADKPIYIWSEDGEYLNMVKMTSQMNYPTSWIRLIFTTIRLKFT